MSDEPADQIIHQNPLAYLLVRRVISWVTVVMGQNELCRIILRRRWRFVTVTVPGLCR